MKQKQKQVKHMLQLHEQKAESFQCFSGTETKTNVSHVSLAAKKSRGEESMDTSRPNLPSHPVYEEEKESRGEGAA